jgi:hypothetical protein
MFLFRGMCMALVTLTVAAQDLNSLQETADASAAALKAARMKQEAGAKRSVQIRSDDGDVLIEGGKEGAGLVFKVGDERLSIDKIPQNMRAYSDATQSILQTGFILGTQQASIADTCADFLKKLNDGVDKDIAELKGSVGDVKDDVDDKLSAAKDATAATLRGAAEDQAKLNAALKKELLAAVQAAKEDAAAAKSAANGFKACDYTKQYFDKQAEACKNVKACGDGEEYSEKPMFADWTCAAAKTDCLPMAELCRAHKGKTGRFAVCGTGDYVYCDMDTEGGKWSLVANIHPKDGNSVGYLNHDFWVHAREYGAINTCLDADYKSPFAATFKGKEILGVSAAYGTNKVLGYRVWGYQKTWSAMFKPGINGDRRYMDCCKGVRTAPCQTTGPKKTVKGTTSSWDDIIRQGSCLRSDVNPSSSGWGDVIRLTTTQHDRRDNTMSGFASCIDCGRPWQSHGYVSGHSYMGIDRAACNQNICYHHAITNLKSPTGEQNYYSDCKGNYCQGTYSRRWNNGWTSQFFIK